MRRSAARSKQKIRFAVQQMVDAMSPANFLATNPEAQQKLDRHQGREPDQGLANMLADMQKGRISQSDESAFEVGRNVGHHGRQGGVRERIVPADPVQP
jgi:polyhydroxyalkanoate synthase